MDMDIGLVKISLFDGDAPPLPSADNIRQVRASGSRVENHLRKLMDARTIGSEILNHLISDCDHDVGMDPHDYQKQLQLVLNQVEEFKSKEKRQSVRNLYGEVGNLLQMELKDNDLLDEFRVMLVQG
jgi:hypothetical protein